MGHATLMVSKIDQPLFRGANAMSTFTLAMALLLLCLLDCLGPEKLGH
jgi:hypothetical protein